MCDGVGLAGKSNGELHEQALAAGHDTLVTADHAFGHHLPCHRAPRRHTGVETLAGQGTPVSGLRTVLWCDGTLRRVGRERDLADATVVSGIGGEEGAARFHRGRGDQRIRQAQTMRQAEALDVQRGSMADGFG